MGLNKKIVRYEGAGARMIKTPQWRSIQWRLIGVLLSYVASLPQGIAFASTADHSQFKSLQQTFTSGSAVTQACLECHSKAADEVMASKHWAWEFPDPHSKKMLGKKNVLTSFSLGIQSNNPVCNACHVGYGWKDNSFDFTARENVDCLVCHDTTGSYRKGSGMAGHPPVVGMLPPDSTVKPVDLNKVAQNVGKPSRDTCGACHFHGGGGDGVKHGDLDSSLAAPEKDVDVHMDALGLDFSCTECHKTTEHQVAGSRYALTAKDVHGALMRGRKDGRNPATCQACHGNVPHKMARLNRHADKLACQTCHIPQFARGGIATKMSWDWSAAGQMDPDGQPLVTKDAEGRVIYDAKKGRFTYGENKVPGYFWFNGKVGHLTASDKIDPARPVPLNRFEGAPDDGESRIWPFKVMRAMQPYDKVHLTMLKAHTTGTDEDSYGKRFDWHKAIARGMKDAGLPFSGQFDFVKTEMSWPITHMVAPKEQALDCVACHGTQSRLAGVPGIHVPGHHGHGWLDKLGWGLAGLSVLGVILHGAGRFFAHRKGARK
jgi:octaheme c-type cytochrome (tetrathionate reductase family)